LRAENAAFWETFGGCGHPFGHETQPSCAPDAGSRRLTIVHRMGGWARPLATSAAAIPVSVTDLANAPEKQA